MKELNDTGYGRRFAFLGGLMTHEIRLTIVVTPRAALLALLMTLVLSAPLDLGSETMTMTTTYPSPVGIYRTIVTTSKTDLARDDNGSGAVVTVGAISGAAKLNIDKPGNTAGNLNVNGLITGTSANIAGDTTIQGSAAIGTGLSVTSGNLSVGGSGKFTGPVTIGSAPNGSCAPDGTLRWNASVPEMEVCSTSQWKPLSGGGAGGGPQPAQEGGGVLTLPSVPTSPVQTTYGTYACSATYPATCDGKTSESCTVWQDGAGSCPGNAIPHYSIVCVSGYAPVLTGHTDGHYNCNNESHGRCVLQSWAGGATQTYTCEHQ